MSLEPSPGKDFVCFFKLSGAMLAAQFPMFLEPGIGDVGLLHSSGKDIVCFFFQLSRAMLAKFFLSTLLSLACRFIIIAVYTVLRGPSRDS
jgi:hypothetical protein